MSTIIELPHVGESVTEGIIGKWLVEPGQRVRKYDPLVEVVTDKVSMEVPSPYTGTLIKTLVAEGETVPMGQPIAEIDAEGDVAAEAPRPLQAIEPVTPSAPAKAPSPPAITDAPQVTGGRNFEFVEATRSVGPTGSGAGGEGRPDALAEAKLAAQAEPASVPQPTPTLRTPDATRQRTRLSPLVRRVMSQNGLDEEAVLGIKGTGLQERITKDDVLRYVEQVRRYGMAAPAVPASVRDGGETTDLALSPLRKTIAQHMETASREIPAAWTVFEVDVTGLVKARAAQKAAFEQRHGVPLTYLPFAAQAVARALRENPRLNAEWAGDHIVLHNRVNLGIAVSTEAGLVVPVVHDADGLSIAELAVRLHALIDAARAQKLKLDDVHGGTFTLNNTGALGSVVSVPIINHPQAAIMTTEAIVKRPVVVDGDAIAVRSMMNVCMTFDHRVCDGAEASGFLASVKRHLESVDPATLL